MKFYKRLSRYEYKELKIQDYKTEEEFTITDRKTMFDEDYYSIYRYLNYKDNVYEFLLMPDGYTLYYFLCDEEAALKLIKENADELIKGKLNTKELIIKFLKLINEYKGENNNEI